MAEYVELSQATTLFGDVDNRFDTVEGKIPSNASSGNKMVTASDIASKADLVDGKVPAAQLPSFVDDVLEYASTSQFPATGESGKIYVALDTNKTYRWGGSDYVEISESLALGETSSTAYAGDKGKANADAISDIQDLIPSGASTFNKLATASDIPTVPTALADLTDDSTHRVVTDTEKSTWSSKQDALTFDNAPTANSNNPVKSGGIKTAIDNSFSASETEIKDTVGWVGKNLHEYPYLRTSQSANGITFTDNGNGTITLGKEGETQTATANTYFVTHENWVIDSGNYIASKGINIGSIGFSIEAFNNSTWVKSVAVSRATDDVGFTLDYNGYNNIKSFIVVNKDTVISEPITVYPMIRKASITDPTYEPYHPSVEEWGFPRSEQAVLGAKNLLPFPYTDTTNTSDGLTYTVNADGSIAASGTSTARRDFILQANHAFQKSKVGDGYILSGCIAGGDSSKYRIFMYNETKSRSYNDLGNGVFIPNSENDNGDVVRIILSVASGQDFTTPATFYPMLRLASDPDDTYVPYAMTNRELTDELTVQSGTVTSDHTIDTGATRLVKYGKIVSLDLKLTGVTANAWDTLATIPDGYKPAKTVNVPNAFGKQSAIATNGVINCSDSYSNQTFVIHAVWVLN